MEYSEEVLQLILENWQKLGYKDLIVLQNRRFFFSESNRHFSLDDAKEDFRVNFFATEAAATWSMHALRFTSGNHKGIFLWSDHFYHENEIPPSLKKQLKFASMETGKVNESR